MNKVKPLAEYSKATYTSGPYVEKSSLKQKLYWKLTYFRDRRIPNILRRIIDFVRDYLWEAEW